MSPDSFAPHARFVVEHVIPLEGEPDLITSQEVSSPAVWAWTSCSPTSMLRIVAFVMGRLSLPAMIP